MTQADKAKQFAALHRKGDPLILFNIWDAGSARRVASAGAKALATGSHAVAEMLGYEDGEDAPLDDMLWMLKRIVASVDLPVSHDSERGYAGTPSAIGVNIARVIEAGAIGINLEDSLADKSLRDTDSQAAILTACKDAMEGVCPGTWLNARTDVLRGAEHVTDELIDAVVQRARAYAEAGADSLFVPFTRDLKVLAKIAAAVPLPINAMRTLDGAPLADYAKAGIARVSHGPFPWFSALDHVSELTKAVYPQP